jgi:hypothetical protein
MNPVGKPSSAGFGRPGGFLTRLPAEPCTPGFSLPAANNIVSEEEKPTAQPTPERPQARNTSV